MQTKRTLKQRLNCLFGFHNLTEVGYAGEGWRVFDCQDCSKTVRRR